MQSMIKTTEKKKYLLFFASYFDHCESIIDVLQITNIF